MKNVFVRPTQTLKSFSMVAVAAGVMFSAGIGHAYAGSNDTVSSGATTSLSDSTSGSASNSSNNNVSTTTSNDDTNALGNTSGSASYSNSTLDGSMSAATTQSTGTGVTFNSTRDCDTNAILNCGAMSTGELIQKYNAADNNTRAVYSYYNISSSDFANLNTTAVAGSVQKNGNVVVNGKVVANGAISAGWHNMNGSTKVSYNGATFYNSTPSVSFVANQIDAYVVLNQNGQFMYAILASCGNPVKASNVVPAPAPAPAPTPAPAAPAELPNTGAASVAEFTGIFSSVSVLGAAAHMFLQRRKAARSL